MQKRHRLLHRLSQPRPIFNVTFLNQTAVSRRQRHRQLYHLLLVQVHQEMVNCHIRCLKHLQETFEESDMLRRQNVHLGSLNLELNKHPSLLIHASVQK
ncbi:hypothetical protein TB2_030501 [Malus domestica]